MSKHTLLRLEAPRGGLDRCSVSPVSAPVTLVVVGRGISEVSVTRAWLEDEEAPKLVELM